MDKMDKINLPLEAIFIFILIISANFLAPIFPCRVQSLLNNNMAAKHLFGFLTMIFFVVLTIPNSFTQFNILFSQSFILYILFILLTKTESYIFFIIFILLAILYIINLKIKHLEESKSKNKKHLIFYKTIVNYLTIIILFVLFIGVLSYLGQKKLEYKNKFNYLYFFLGKPVCKNKSPSNSFIAGLLNSFS